MRYLGIAEAYLIAEAVTGIDAKVLARASRGDLLDSALNAPQAGFDGVDLYPSLIQKAAVLCIRITQNHPLLDGNKRLAWIAMVVFLEMNDALLEADEDDAVATMMSVAAGRLNETSLALWLSERVQSSRPEP